MSKKGKDRVAGLLLAAGASVRMGEPKQMMKVGGRTLLERILKEALASDLDRVVLVLGHRSEEIRENLGDLLRSEKLRVVENKEYERGISTSILAGLGEAEAACDHVMVLLADMPGLTSGVINGLIHAYVPSGAPLGAVAVRGRRSHPVIFSRALYRELHQLTGDMGARGLFKRHADKVLLVDAGADYDDTDLDTPEDLKRLME
jgi:molybdenum cofactor cytidylyltransferase